MREVDPLKMRGFPKVFETFHVESDGRRGIGNFSELPISAAFPFPRKGT